MSDSKEELKKQKKLAKAKVKIAKAETKAKEKQIKEESKIYNSLIDKKKFPQGITITINEKDKTSDLIVTGLTQDQMKRILPRLNRDLLITFTEEHNPLRASLLRFLREGLFHTLIKVIAGLIVGYVLFYIGLR
ncbi:MAG: hypothetical protein R6V04_11675 [bacterium]